LGKAVELCEPVSLWPEHTMPQAGAKECQAAEHHGLPCPVLGTNGEVTAVSNPDQERRRRSIHIVAGDQLNHGALKASLRAGLTARP